MTAHPEDLINHGETEPLSLWCGVFPHARFISFLFYEACSDLLLRAAQYEAGASYVTELGFTGCIGNGSCGDWPLLHFAAHTMLLGHSRLSARREGDVGIDEPGPFRPVGATNMLQRSFPAPVTRSSCSIFWY